MTSLSLDHPSTDQPSDRAARIAQWGALFSGAALVVDTVTIMVINGSFGILDDVLFLSGFVGVWITGVALAVTVSRAHRGAARVGVGVGVFLGLAVVLGVLSASMDQLGRHVFSTANVGLHGEWSFFTIGVCLLALAGWTRVFR